MQQQLLTCFSTWFKLWGDRKNLIQGVLSKVIPRARRSLSSWTSLSSTMNFKGLEEGDDGGMWLLFGVDIRTCNIGITCELVGGSGDTFDGGDILDFV